MVSTAFKGATIFTHKSKLLWKFQIVFGTAIGDLHACLKYFNIEHCRSGVIMIFGQLYFVGIFYQVQARNDL